MRRELDTERASRGDDPSTPATETGRRDRWLTVPNVLSALRLLGSPLMIALAWARLPAWCLGLFAVLLVSDWVDGKLAKRWKQETVTGARLDTVADLAFYGCLLVAMLYLRWDIIIGEMMWISLAVASYAVNVSAAVIKFRRFPSYHTRLAKSSWLLICLAVVAITARWSVWPLRVAMMGVVLANLEATAITLVLPAWRVNVSSVYRAVQIKRNSC